MPAAFQFAALAILYSTSTMEHHHFDQCVMILNSEGNNIFQVCLDTSFLPFESEFCWANNEIPFQWKIIFPLQSLSPEDYRQVMNVVESAILSTDLAMYFKKRDKFLDLIDNGEFDWQSDEKKERTLIGIFKADWRNTPCLWYLQCFVGWWWQLATWARLRSHGRSSIALRSSLPTSSSTKVILRSCNWTLNP